jgi:hypothetical protein
MIYPTAAGGDIPPGSCFGGSTYGYVETGSTIKESGEVYCIQVQSGRRHFYLLLAGRISSGTTSWARRIWHETVPRNDLLKCNGWCSSGLIGINNVGKEGSPAIMRISISVVKRSSTVTEESEIVSSEWTDIMRLAIVIPGNDLNKLRRYLDYLLPAIIPQIIASPHPVLSKSREICIKPGANRHHIWLSLGTKRSNISLITGRRYVHGSDGPCVPAEKPIDNARCFGINWAN